MNEQFTILKLTCGALATIGLFSVLYRETKIYRFFEHMFLGLAAGYALVAIWTETLYTVWWQKMTGVPGTATSDAVPGMWLYVVLLPIGLLGYTVFSKKNNWLSRIPIGIILGMWSGQQVLNYWRFQGPQILSSMKPIMPTTTDSFLRPATSKLENGELVPVAPDVLATINSNIYPTQAISNLIFVVTLIAAMSYFIFSYDLKGKVATSLNTLGRWLLMIGFGAIFGGTVMARFSLVIDRMAYIWLEWLRLGG